MAEDSRQGSGIIYLGTPANPTLYTARVLRGPSEWQRLAVAFVATAPTVRISLLGQASSAGKTVEYDGIRFLPPGRNPVLLMAAIFARFLPHLTLDPVSVQVAADRRNEWLFSGYIPDPGRTDALLTRMSQECFCTVFKDLDGVYKITADDPDHLAVLHLDSQHDIVQETLEVQGLPMDQVYTDFYLWYQRVTTQVTTSQAGQYAAVIYVTPDDSISQYAELQTLCSQAASTLQTRARFDFYSDFIADPATADLLLSRFVRQLSVLRREVALQAALPALPLSLTDHVAVRAPLMGQQPFVGEMRRYALAFTAQAPGLGLGLTLRESGLVRGVWETWDVGGLTPSGDPADPGGPTDPGGPRGPMGPPGAARVRERWDADDGPGPGDDPWHHQATLPIPLLAALMRLVDTEAGVTDLLGAGGLPGSAQAPVWRSSDVGGASRTDWTPALTPVGGGDGTALGIFSDEVSDPTQTLRPVYAPIHPTSSPGASEVWRLDAAFFATPTLACPLPGGTVVTAMLENAGSLFLGTSAGDVYRWTPPATPSLVLSTTGDAVRSLSIMRLNLFPDPMALVAFIEASSGLLTYYTMRNDELAPDVWAPYTFEGLTGTRCSNAQEIRNRISAANYSMIATGTEAGDRVDMWELGTTAATLVRSFTERGNQRPGVIEALYMQEEDAWPWVFVGRHSLSTTPLLSLWVYHPGAMAGAQWRQSANFATSTDGSGVTDTNTSITALAQLTLHGKVYAATGTPHAGPQPGARVYVYPTPD